MYDLKNYFCKMSTKSDNIITTRVISRLFDTSEHF